MFCGLGMDPPRPGERLASMQGSSGTRLLVPLSLVHSPSCYVLCAAHPLPSLLTPPPAPRSPAVPPPSAGSAAPRLPDLTDFDSDPLLHYVSLEFLRAPGISLPLPLRARRLHGTISKVQPAFITTMRLLDSPTKGPKRRTLRLYPGENIRS